MSEWMSCTLGDVVECIQTGPFGSQLHQSDYSVSGIPVVMPQDMAGGRIETANIARVEQLHVNRLKRHKIQEGNIVYSRRGDVGRSAYVEKHQEGWLCGTGCLLVRLDKTKVCPQFIAYYLRQPSQVRWVENNAVGITMLNLNTGILSKAPLNIPRSIDEQRKIANILASLDSKIELNQRLNDNLEAMAQALYDYWFVQFDFPDENGKPYKSSGGKMVWNEKLKREIPEGWSTEAVGEITLCHDSRRIPLSGKERETMQGDIPYYGATGIFGYVDRHIFDGDFVLLAEDGSVMNEKGRPIIQRVSGKVWINNHTHVLQPSKEHGCKLLMMMLSEIPVEKIKTGSIQAKINQANLNAYSLVKIPRTLISQMNKILDEIDSRLLALAREINTLTKQRDFLLPLLMSGQVQVKPQGELNYHLSACGTSGESSLVCALDTSSKIFGYRLRWPCFDKYTAGSRTVLFGQLCIIL